MWVIYVEGIFDFMRCAHRFLEFSDFVRCIDQAYIAMIDISRDTKRTWVSVPVFHSLHLHVPVLTVHLTDTDQQKNKVDMHKARGDFEVPVQICAHKF
jgi:hypothetical protein